MTVQILRDDCKCGHDRGHHYKDTTPAGIEWCNCLAMHCDCTRFRAPGTPSTIPPPPVAPEPDDECPVTPRMWPWPWP